MTPHIATARSFSTSATSSSSVGNFPIGSELGRHGEWWALSPGAPSVALPRGSHGGEHKEWVSAFGIGNENIFGGGNDGTKWMTGSRMNFGENQSVGIGLGFKEQRQDFEGYVKSDAVLRKERPNVKGELPNVEGSFGCI